MSSQPTFPVGSFVHRSLAVNPDTDHMTTEANEVVEVANVMVVHQLVRVVFMAFLLYIFLSYCSH